MYSFTRMRFRIVFKYSEMVHDASVAVYIDS